MRKDANGKFVMTTEQRTVLVNRLTALLIAVDVLECRLGDPQGAACVLADMHRALLDLHAVVQMSADSLAPR